MTFDQLDFVTYCIGAVAERMKLNQRDVYRRLKDSGVLYGYVVPAFDVLHTFSGQYITDDIIHLLAQREQQ